MDDMKRLLALSKYARNKIRLCQAARFILAAWFYLVAIKSQ